LPASIKGLTACARAILPPFQPEAYALGHLRRGERGPAAEERVVQELTALQVIENRPAHELDGLLRRMIELVFA
jgi:hypothetical protein